MPDRGSGDASSKARRRRGSFVVDKRSKRRRKRDEASGEALPSVAHKGYVGSSYRGIGKPEPHHSRSTSSYMERYAPQGVGRPEEDLEPCEVGSATRPWSHKIYGLNPEQPVIQ
jgi:hypothetical protein